MKSILNSLSRLDRPVATVAIGGINLSNVQRVLYQSAGTAKQLDGVAVVSAIMAADDPKSGTEEFRKVMAIPPRFVTRQHISPRENEAQKLVADVPGVVQKVVNVHPIVHSMINFVVANFVANVAIAAYVFFLSPPPF